MVTLTSEHSRLVCVTKARCRFHQRVKYRPEIDGGAADNFEHVAGCGELIHRAREFGLALAQLTQEPHVLDRNDRLIGEGCYQLDLSVGKWANLRTRQSYNANAIFISD